MNCVIYIRVSSDDQVLGKSLEAQQQDCEAHARQQGWNIIRVFREPGESAKSADRPVFQEMMRFCRDRKTCVKRIVFWKISRFMRNIEDGFHFIRELKELDCRIASATEPIPDGVSGKILLTISLLQADCENDLRSQQTRRVMEQLSLEGYWVHQAPYGFKTARDSGDFPILQPNPATAESLAHVFHSIADGTMVPVSALAYLRAQGISGVRASAPLSLKTLHDLLRKEVYCGRVRNSYTGGRAVPARFTGLVDEQVFDRVQARLSGREPAIGPRRKLRDEFPLRGFVMCESCRGLLTASWSRGRSARYAYYSCPRCARHSVRKESLEREFLSLLDGITLRNTGRLSAFREILMEEWTAMHGELDRVRAQSQARVKALQEKATRLLDKLLDGTIGDDVYRVRDQALKADLAVAKAQDDACGAPSIQLPVVLQYADQLLRDLSGAWLALKGEPRQWFQQGIFPSRLSWGPNHGLGTGVTNHLFSALEGMPAHFCGLAPPTGSTWNRPDILLLVTRLENLREKLAA